MIEMEKKEKIIIGSSFVVICFALGLFFTKVYQTPQKVDNIYKEALADYNKGDYSNAYYLFSKVTPFSDLKPAAIYHQAEAAKAVGDNASAIKKYQLVFNHYPKNPLALRAKYSAAQLLLDDNPKLAKKYFDQIIKEAPDSDFAIASEYYYGVLIVKYYTKDSETIFPLSKKQDAEEAFRHYLKKAPSGRLALNAIDNWLSLNKEIASDDYLLMAKSLYKFGEYPRVKELLAKTSMSESWALDAKNAYVMGNYPRARALTETGLKKYSTYVDEQDIFDAVDIYMKISSDTKFNTASKLYTMAEKKGGDYIMNLKCRYSETNSQSQCYKHLYLKYTSGKFSADALSQVFLSAIRKNDLENAKKIGLDHLNKFKNANSTPMVMYWMGRIAEKQRDYSEYLGYYKSVIAKYPDSYYAYRAYLKLNHMTGPIITDYIKEQPVEYPYKSKSNLVKRLASLEDYDVLNEISSQDGFIQSWVLYKKGDFQHSVILARNAMDELDVKPDKYDVRWRLVYPIHYYDVIKKYANNAGNNSPLMLSIVREESYFNPDAVSVAGAKGLMQILPSTAAEVAAKRGIGSYNLFNPTSNIIIGNYYYAELKSMLEGLDISAIASYNGGIGSVKRWRTSLYYNDTDDFIEQIPYEETQNYVKKVFRSYWNYIRIYNGNN